MSDLYDETKAAYIAERNAGMGRTEPTMMPEDLIDSVEPKRPPQPWMVTQATIERDTTNLPEQQPQEVDEEAAAYERVHHPAHYNQHPSGVECIDIIEHMPANIALSWKHTWRIGLTPYSDALTDLDKAIFYLQREKERIVRFGLFK